MSSGLFIPNALKRLARLFQPKATLYAVGGFVRDGLLDLERYDVDVASALEAEEVKQLLAGSEFSVADHNMRMGTLHIRAEGFVAEYTAFRQDSYDRRSGKHDPIDVRFTSDMREDALRRDFSCNSVYLDILADKLYDPVGGLEDLKNHILRASDSPEKVFEADGLRILRLVRFAAELGFDIDPDTERAARLNAYRVKDIAAERVRDELDSIFLADVRHPELKDSKAHLRGFRLLDSLGLVDILLPELATLRGLQQPKKWHLYDAFEHSVKAFEISPPAIRWAALLHDVGKARSVELTGYMRSHDVLGEQMARDILNRLRFKNADKDKICKMILRHMFDKNGDTPMPQVKAFVIDNVGIVDDLILLMETDAIATAGVLTRPNRVREAYESMREAGLPFSIGQLKVDGNDLLALGVPQRRIGELLKDLLYATATDPALNDKQNALEHVKKRAFETEAAE